jgi:heme-degrading monooxygenase HmoA
MIAVMFELQPAAGQEPGYLAQAAQLRPLLDKHPGFISVERFRSIATPDKLLSLSFFEDGASVAAWRNTEQHRQSQTVGRGDLFDNYRLRIAEVSRDYGLHDRAQAPKDSRLHHR